MSEPLGTSDIALLLGISRPRVWQLRKDAAFPEPAGRDAQGREYWCEASILRWAASARKNLADKAPLLWRPTSGQAAPYLGLAMVDGHAVMTWDAELGRIGLVYAPAGLPIDRTGKVLQNLLRRANADVLVAQDAGQFTTWGPDLRAVDAAAPERIYSPRWEDLARAIGAPAPFWPTGLIQPEAMARWTPGTPPLDLTPRHPELDTAPLLRLHSTSPDDSTAARATLHLARAIDAQAAQAARVDIGLLNKSGDRQHIALAATVLEGPHADDPDEAVLRDGWSQILTRTDMLAHDCVELASQWDGGRYFPFSVTTRLRLEHSPEARAWKQRLQRVEDGATDQPIEPTAAMIRLARDARAYFTDPATDLPAAFDLDGVLRAAVPQRLPATTPLAEVILRDRKVWIRTADRALYLAPEQSGCGLSWGYSGSGPVTLAHLLDLLLDDINATAPHHVPSSEDPVPEGLMKLTANTPRDEGATYTRGELLAARAR
ncbi:helix-turn-helix transcriptional regulator [Actinomadura nitritigenes]|uniref:helix-turn-helix transcriptional regulator n=1 Tax=Actinomadura nitritigenes TaxID=134602 RepID=UPI003D94B169